MIQSLRTRHRFMIGALSVVLPVAFVGGIVARKPVPTMAPVPSLSVDAHSAFATTLWERDDSWSQHSFRTRLVAASERSRGVVVTMESELSKPDVLLYWSPGESAALERLSESAVLLGALIRSTALPLPQMSAVQTGQLMLYSLADHELLAVSKPFLAQQP